MTQMYALFLKLQNKSSYFFTIYEKSKTISCVPPQCLLISLHICGNINRRLIVDDLIIIFSAFVFPKLFVRRLSVNSPSILPSSSVDTPYCLHWILTASSSNVHRIDGHSVDIRWRFGGHSPELYRRIKGVSTEN